MESGYLPNWLNEQGYGIGPGNIATRKVLNPSKLVLVSESGSEPVSLADLKAWLRVDQIYEDGLITQLGISARRQIEKYCNRSLVKQTFDLWFDNIPPTNYFDFPWLPVTTVTSITTYGLDNQAVVQDATTYQTDLNDDICQCYLNISNIWNVPVRPKRAFVCRFEADGTVNLQKDVLIEAVKVLTDIKYQSRGQQVDSKNPIAVDIPESVKKMLNPFKLVRL